MSPDLDARTRELFDERIHIVYRRADRLFAVLLLAQWAFAVVLALVVSPRTWAGAEASVHVHVWAALGLGGLITLVPVALALRQPGRALTRHSVAAAQLLMSGLLIHLTGGRIETHFHVFASLGILLAYQDWRVLLTAAAVTAVDHLLRGLFFPESVYGVLTVTPWRTVEHAAYVVFMVAFLVRFARSARQDLRAMARQQATLEEQTAEQERLMAALEAERAEAEARRREVEEHAAAREAYQARVAADVDLLIHTVNAFADGDLTVHLEATDEDRLFRAFNRSVAKVRAALEEVRAAAAVTASVADEIGGSAEQLAASTQEQSAQADEVAAAIEEMAATVADNARAASETARAAEVAGAEARTGGETVRRTVQKVRDIAASVSAGCETVERLGASSERVGQIVATIEAIAEQTNLLALNAAIEAARAGEHGRGFAVVADEVRKLAERTAQATAEVSALLSGIRAETDEAVTTMRRGAAEAEEGLRLADAAGAALERIVEGTEAMVGMITQIAAASEEQSTTSEEMARAADAIRQATHDAARGVARVADTADRLRRLTEELSRLVAQFRTETAPAGDGRATDRLPALTAA